MKIWNAVKAFISHYFGDESAAINETMKYGPVRVDAVDPETNMIWCSSPLPVDYPAVDQSEEIIDDGFGNKWVNHCCKCGQATLEVVRPGKVQCHSDVCNPSEEPAVLPGPITNVPNLPSTYAIAWDVAAHEVKPKYEVLDAFLLDLCGDWPLSSYRVEGDRVIFPASFAGDKVRIEYTIDGAYTSKTVRLKRRNENRANN